MIDLLQETVHSRIGVFNILQQDRTRFRSESVEDHALQGDAGCIPQRRVSGGSTTEHLREANQELMQDTRCAEQ
jgi:hypothetical protein